MILNVNFKVCVERKAILTIICIDAICIAVKENSCNCVGNCGCTKSCGGYVDPELERQYHLSEEHGD